MEAKFMTHNEHIGKYVASLPSDLHIQRYPIQIYRLEQIATHLKYPTPLIKPKYNLVIHITNGYISGQVDRKQVNQGEGSAILLMANRIIARNKFSDDLKGFCIIIDNKIISDLISDNQLLKLFGIYPIVVLKEESHKTLLTLNNLIMNEMSKENPNLNFSKVTLQAVFIKLLEEANIPNSQLTRQEEIAFKFQRLACLNDTEQRKISFFAKKLFISENYLNRCVKQVLQKSPKTVLAEAIVQRSQSLLLSYRKDVSEVAYELGFNDPSYFSRLFKKLTGKTPSDYRNDIMHNLSEH